MSLVTRRCSCPARRGGALKGCLIAVAVVVVLVIAAGVVVWLNWKNIAAGGMKVTTAAMVDASTIPDDQKTHIKTRMDTVFNDWKAEKITGEQLGKVMDEIAKGPVLNMAMVGMVNMKYVEPSALTKEEKAAADIALQRFARGVFEKSIPQSEVETVLGMIRRTDTPGQNQFKETLTPDELKKLIDHVKDQADKAKVPDEPFKVDYASEIDKAIDAALKPAP